MNDPLTIEVSFAVPEFPEYIDLASWLAHYIGKREPGERVSVNVANGYAVYLVDEAGRLVRYYAKVTP